jgi:hypothetical protein
MRASTDREIDTAFANLVQASSYDDMTYQSGIIVERILKAEKPGDLPV